MIKLKKLRKNTYLAPKARIKTVQKNHYHIAVITSMRKEKPVASDLSARNQLSHCYKANGFIRLSAQTCMKNKLGLKIGPLHIRNCLLFRNYFVCKILLPLMRCTKFWRLMAWMEWRMIKIAERKYVSMIILSIY